MGPAAAYLAATRRPRPSFILRDHYRAVFDSLQKRLRGFGASPQFDLTYSSERTCETIRSGTDNIVIYDQYLGQTFNQFNRLHANATSPFEVLVYAYKVAAEFAQIDGQPLLATLLAMAHVSHHEKTRAHLQDSDIAWRMGIGAHQEAYVITHEAFHSIVEHQADWRREMIRDARRDFLTNYYLRALHHMEEEQSPDLETAGPMFLRQIELFGKDDALVEECICDTLAIGVLCPHPEEDVSLDRLELVRDAIFFALRHLRLLALIRHTVHQQRSDAVEDENWLEPYLVRTQFLQWTLGQFPALHVLRDEAIQARFEARQERYSTFVEDPILYELPGIVEELSARQSLLPVGADLDDRLIDKFLGGPEFSSSYTALGEEFFLSDPETVTQESYDERMRELENRLRKDAAEDQKE